MPLALNDILEVTTYCTLFEQVGINVLHYSVSGIVGAGRTQQEVCDLLDTRWKGFMVELISSEASADGLTIQNLSQPTVPPSVSANAAEVGLVGGHPLPRQTAGFIRKRSQFAGRRGTGRMYAPFATEDSNDPNFGAPSNGYVNSLQQFADGMMPLATFDLGVGMDRIGLQSGVYSPTDVLFTPMLKATAVQKWATQRRRGSFGRPEVSPFQ